MLAGAPLIICPSNGDQISKKMRKVCRQFKEEHNIDGKIFERGGTKLGLIVKSDPLKPPVCGRGDCFPCANEGGGDCSKSCAGYKLECQECPKFKMQFIMEKQGEMLTAVVLSILLVYRTKKKTIHYGNIVYCSTMDNNCNLK